MRQVNTFSLKIFSYSWLGIYKNGCCEDNVTLVYAKSRCSCLYVKTSIIETNFYGTTHIFNMILKIIHFIVNSK